MFIFCFIMDDILHADYRFLSQFFKVATNCSCKIKIVLEKVQCLCLKLNGVQE